MDIEISVCVVCSLKESDHGGQNHPYIPHGWDALMGRPRAEHFKSHKVNPAGGLYVTIEDTLSVTVTTSVAGIEVDVAARMQLANGEIIPMQKQLFPTTARASNTFNIPLFEGFLLSVAANTPTAAVRRGQCYVNLSLVRGVATAPIDLYDLTEGYVITANDIGWPWPDAGTSVDLEGVPVSFHQGNPGAGNDWAVTVPTGARWKVRSLSAQLVTSGSAGNRNPSIVILDAATNALFAMTFAGNQPASTTMQWSAGEGSPIFTNATFGLGNLPNDCTLLQGWQIASQTGGILAGDVWSKIYVNAMEWLEL